VHAGRLSGRALVTLERVEHGRIELAGLLPARGEVGSPGHRAYDAGNETGEQECGKGGAPRAPPPDVRRRRADEGRNPQVRPEPIVLGHAL
jgi:hypothetical protein